MKKKDLKPLNNFSEFIAAHTLRQRVRNTVRDSIVYGSSIGSRIPIDCNWIRFPYYHHVFNDERRGFERHLKFYQNHGEIISLSDAVSLLTSQDTIDGRYFCITFDDGFKNCATNAVPILLDYNVTAAFFLPTDYIGKCVDVEDPAPVIFYKPLEVLFEFLTWDDCREMARVGMILGAHTLSHPRLIDLSRDEVEWELSESKKIIESELNEVCEHFCCPTGRPGKDFIIDRDPDIASQLGYRSFLTTRRGSVHRKSDPMLIERDHTIAAWGTYQLRYFFSK